jgi:predicted Zn-dependent protease
VTKRRLAIALIGLLTGSLALAVVPPPLQPGEKPLTGSTEAELWYGMDQAEKELRQAPVLVRDPALNAYVHEVACKVTGDYCSNLRVYIVDVPVFNASMAPNGAMLVFTGALLRMHDESELALVLGHEFAHFKLRHSLQYWEKAKHTSAFLATLSVVTYAGGVSLVGSVAQLVGAANMFSYSRDKEREADRVGFQVATALGYDPQAGVRIWTRMLAEEKANPRPKPSPVFASHPKTAERLQDITAAANALPAGSVNNRTETYHAAMRPFLDHWLEAELSRRMYDTSIEVIGNLKTTADVDSQGTYCFYLAEAYRRRNKADDRSKAQSLYLEAVSHADAPADAWREQGLILRENGQRAEAALALHHYLDAKPTAGDRAFIEKYLTELETLP